MNEEETIQSIKKNNQPNIFSPKIQQILERNDPETLFSF